ncbi:MAG: low temperature requirement protein A [Nocardioides sp.]
MSETLRHTVARMSGRDPHETGRAATPLELLFDLTFVIAFGVAADELAHLVTDHHVREGILGFCFAAFAVSWAWINFSWFASAYDTDDWIYRLTTMVQMVGVLVLALGLHDMFDSLVEGDHLDNAVMVLGYVVMRVPMIAQWMRASHQDPERREVCKVFILTLTVSQLGWIALIFLDLSISATFACVIVLVLVELLGPFVAEHVRDGTPWHPHHIAERYGLLVIIALGEGLLGTTVALGALIDVTGWTLDAALLGLAGTGLTFGLWWIYFVIPSGPLLRAYRARVFSRGSGHIPLFAAVVAVGAGLHAAAYYLEGHSALSATETLTTMVVPLAVYYLGIFLLYAALTHTLDPLHYWILGGTAAIIAAAIGLSVVGAPLPVTVLVLALSPWLTVVAYEVAGHRHNAEVLASLSQL